MAPRKLSPRLLPIPEDELTPRHRELMEAIRSGPRGRVSRLDRSGSFCTHRTSAIWRKNSAPTAVTRRRSHRDCRNLPSCAPRACGAPEYEWFAHAPIAEKAGVAAATIHDLRAGRAPRKARKDERAIYDFIRELYKTRRVSDRNYKRVHAILGDPAMVEFVEILGYYALVAMALDVFRIPLPDGAALPFAEVGSK